MMRYHLLRRVSGVSLLVSTWPNNKGQDDESRLLLDDPNSYQYGSFSEQNMNTHADALETQREIEALQKVVAKTSKYAT
jgi:hypothetical protein